MYLVVQLCFTIVLFYFACCNYLRFWAAFLVCLYWIIFQPFLYNWNPFVPTWKSFPTLAVYLHGSNYCQLKCAPHAQDARASVEGSSEKILMFLDAQWTCIKGGAATHVLEPTFCFRVSFFHSATVGLGKDLPLAQVRPGKKDLQRQTSWQRPLMLFTIVLLLCASMGLLSVKFFWFASTFQPGR